jgi:hypothetical protein
MKLGLEKLRETINFIVKRESELEKLRRENMTVSDFFLLIPFKLFLTFYV